VLPRRLQLERLELLLQVKLVILDLLLLGQLHHIQLLVQLVLQKWLWELKMEKILKILVQMVHKLLQLEILNLLGLLLKELLKQILLLLEKLGKQNLLLFERILIIQ
jgi:hypothetical protein